MGKLWRLDVKATTTIGVGIDEERRECIEIMFINPNHIVSVHMPSNTIRLIDGTQYTLTDYGFTDFLEKNYNVS